MNNYFVGAIGQMIGRAQALLERIPVDLPRELDLLAQRCQLQLNDCLDDLRELLDNPLMSRPEYQSERLRLFRRAVTTIDDVETLGIRALERHHPNDVAMNKLVEAIRREIAYPLLPPIVTSLSESYYYIYLPLNLLSVPLGEGQFLLHLPDLYHELAHPLIEERHNPRVKPFQQALGEAMDDVLTYLEGELDKRSRRGEPDIYEFYIVTWQNAWIRSWLNEFFCDLFAIYTLGPAFAWAHLHLCAKRGGNPYCFPPYGSASHPADDARMTAMLNGLQLIGFSNEASAIEQEWRRYIAISGARAEPEFRRCYKPELLKEMAQKAYLGVQSIKCRVVAPSMDGQVFRLLNGAWDRFWKCPTTYSDWERSVVSELFQNADINTSFETQQLKSNVLDGREAEENSARHS